MRTLSRSRLLAGLIAVLAACGNEVSITEPVQAEPDLKVIAAARPAAPSTSTTVSVQNTCDITVTYTWSGFKGRNLIANVGVFYRGGGNLDVGISNFSVEGQAGSAGSVSHTFTLTANATGGRQLLGRGDLETARKLQRVDGSASSSTLFFSTCG